MLFQGEKGAGAAFVATPVFNVMVQGPSQAALQAYMSKLRRIQVRLLILGQGFHVTLRGIGIPRGGTNEGSQIW